MKNRTMKNWLFASLTLLVFVISACSKHTTPRRVNRVLSAEGSWKITSFTIEGVSVMESYNGYSFTFDEDGGIKVRMTGGSTVSGSWETGLDKNPCILYLSFPPVGGLEYIADDWQVSQVKKDVLTLKRNDDNSSSNLTLKR